MITALSPGKPLAIVLLAYLLGSVPFAILLTRLRTGRDVRELGSGHSGATNAMRAAGWGVGVLVMVLDIAKSWIPMRMAIANGLPGPWLALTAAAAVAGHCWPVVAGFRGGMGVAVAGGVMLAVWPLGFAAAAGLASLLTLLIRHAARALVVTGLVIAPAWYAFGGEPEALWVAAAAGLLVALRARSDWRRKYRELWLDRDAGDLSSDCEPG